MYKGRDTFLPFEFYFVIETASLHPERNLPLFRVPYRGDRACKKFIAKNCFDVTKFWKTMGFINLRDSRTKKRTRIDNVDLSASVKALKEKAADIIQLGVQEQRGYLLIHAGR